jgi:hypothetical protein
MRVLAWMFLVCGGLIWSGLAWVGWLTVEWAGGFASRNADLLTAYPETVVWLSWAAGLIAAVGQGGVVAVWLVGLAALAALAALLLAWGRSRRSGWANSPGSTSPLASNLRWRGNWPTG